MKKEKLSQNEAQQVNFTEFGNLHFDRRITKAIKNHFKFKSPTFVQSKMIPIALKGGNLLVKARTGSGKTLGYAIPLINSLLNKCEGKGKLGPLKAIIIVPTKELSEQVYEVVSKLITYCDDILSVQQSHQIIHSQLFHLHNLPTILISTPTSILSMLSQFSKATSRNFDLRQSVEILIVDEADLMDLFGFSPAMHQLGKLLPNSSSNHYQAILCSATLSDDVEQLKSLMLHKPTIIKLEANENQASSGNIGDGEIVQHYTICKDNNEKYLVIYALIALELIPKHCLIFTNTLDNAYRLMIFFERFSIPAGVLSPSMPFTHRQTILQTFNQNILNVLIATEEAMEEVNNYDENIHKSQKMTAEEDEGEGYVAIHRGLDLQGVQCVVNFDIPASETGYIHRVGRTGRGGTQGIALTLVKNIPEELTQLSILSKSDAILEINPPQSNSHQGLKPFIFDQESLNSFQYRVLNVLRGITKKCVQEKKLQILQKEALHNTRLKAYFDEHPADALTLKKALRNIKSNRSQKERLNYIPDYLMDSASNIKQNSIQLAIKNQVILKQPAKFIKKSTSRKSVDPLKTFETSTYKHHRKFNILNQLKKQQMGSNVHSDQALTLSGRKLWKLRHKKKLKKPGLPGNFLRKKK